MGETCLLDIVPVDKETGITQPRHEWPECTVAFFDHARNTVQRMEQIKPDGEHSASGLLCQARNDAI